LEEMMMTKGIKKLLDYCLGLKAGEEALVITDTGMDPKIPNLFAIMAAERGADVALMTISPRPFQGSEPPRHVAGAMKNCDAIIETTSVFIGHSIARFDALKAGTRWLCCTCITPAILAGPSGLDMDFEALKPMVDKIVELETKAKHVKVTTKEGTNFTARLEGRQARGLHGLVRNPGEFQAPPNVESSISPIESSVNGVVVITGFADMGGGVVKEPIKITVKDGKAFKIEGGREAEAVRSTLEATGNPDAYTVSEFGIGLNPKSILQHNSICECEGVFGSAHIALGTSPWPEVNLMTPIHMDLVFLRATVELDGKVILQDGQPIPELMELIRPY